MATNHISTMIMACIRWRNLLPEIKEVWGRRSAWINTLPRPGKFESLEEYNIQNGNILESLTLEQNFIGVLISAVVHKHRTPLSQLEVCFGKERVKILSQSYRKFDISFLLQLCIFGKGFSNLKYHEIISKTEKTIFIHIELAIQMKELF